MVASTPHTQAHDGLAALASRFVSVDENRFWDKIVSTIQEMVIPE